jgi:hypothetical protein
MSRGLVTGLFALLTTIAGAVAGANLTVLALDVAWDLQARERSRRPAERLELARASQAA